MNPDVRHGRLRRGAVPVLHELPRRLPLPSNDNRSMDRFDVVGVGLNATDTLLLLPRFPAYAGKVAFD